MKDEILINNYIAKGILEANIDFAKNHKSLFCLVKFGYDVDLDDAFTFKNLISLIHIFTDFSPILLQENNSFLIFLKDTKIHQAKALMNKLTYQIRNKLDIDLQSIGITLNDYNDTYKILLNRVDKYFVMSKLSSRKKVFYGTVDFDYYDAMDHLKVFRRVFKKRSKITIHNMYKGIPINEQTKIKEYSEEGIIQLNVSSGKIPFYQRESFTFIEHDFIPDIIKADIIKIDENRSLMILGNLQLLNSSPIERSDIRVEPDKKFYITISEDTKKLLSGYISSISISSISIESDQKQIDKLIDKNIFGKELNAEFKISNKMDFTTNIKTRAYIFSIVNTKVVINILPTPTTKEKIKNYISSRQNEILLALKKELNL